MKFLYLHIFIAITASYNLNKKSNELVPYNIYDNLKCIPKVNVNDGFISEYVNCPHIGREENTCHFKGKIYKVNEQIDPSSFFDIWNGECQCKDNSKFYCQILPYNCKENLEKDYPSPGCYLHIPLGNKCSIGQICPLSDNITKCKVGSLTYREGEYFSHPTQRCSKCICAKGFDYKFEAPFCQPINCTYSLFQNPRKIDNFCAPFYRNDECCPTDWFCPDEIEKGDPAPSFRKSSNDLQCTFGNHKLNLDDSFNAKHRLVGDMTCTCVLPPYLYCKSTRRSN